MANKKRSLIVLAAALTVALALDNMRIDVTHYNISDEDLPAEFDGFKIVQVSDLHNTLFGKDQARLLRRIRSEAPDLIALTGDLIDLDVDSGNTFKFIKEAVRIAPCFYVSGNHEARLKSYERKIKPKLQHFGVRILEDESTPIIIGKSQITLTGLSDPEFTHTKRPAKLTDQKLSLLENDNFTVLLSHRPELLHIYSRHNISLALTGHAHGGQIRLPFMRRGMFAPDQGALPKYTEGIFEENNTKTIVSRGLGNRVLVPRVNNRPELVSITLKQRA